MGADPGRVVVDLRPTKMSNVFLAVIDKMRAGHNQQINAVLEGVRSWPEEDQEELIEIAREIEARRTGIYVLSDDKRAAIQKSRSGPLASMRKSRRSGSDHPAGDRTE